MIQRKHFGAISLAFGVFVLLMTNNWPDWYFLILLLLLIINCYQLYLILSLVDKTNRLKSELQSKLTHLSKQDSNTKRQELGVPLESKDEELGIPLESKDEELGVPLELRDEKLENSLTMNHIDLELIDSCCKLIAKIDSDSNRFIDPKKLANHYSIQLIRICQSFGIETIENDTEFDINLHLTVNSKWTPKGTKIDNFVRPGLRRGNKILLKAIVETL